MTNDSTDWSWDFTPQMEPENPQPREPAAGEPAAPPAAPGPQSAQNAPASPPPTPPTAPPNPAGAGAPTNAPGSQPSQFAQYAGGAAAASPGAYTRFQRHDVDDYQPGVMPLRPLRFAEFFDCAFRTLRYNPQTIFAYSAIVMAFGIIVYIMIHPSLMGIMENPEEEQVFSTIGSLAWQSMMQGLLTVVVIGFLVYAVVGAVQGNKLTFAQVWQSMKGKILPLIGLIFTSVFLMIMVMSVVGGLTYLLVLFAAEGNGNLPVGVAIGIFAILVPTVVTLAVILYTTLAIPILVVENTGVFRSLGRSLSLVKGYFWRSFALLGLAWVMVAIIGGVVSGLIAPLITTIMQSAGLLTTEYGAASATMISTVGVSSAVQVLTTPFFAAFLTLVYTDIRMRKEGLDIALIEASAARR